MPLPSFRDDVLVVGRSPEDLAAAMAALPPSYRIKGFTDSGRMLDWIGRREPPRIIFLDLAGERGLAGETLRRLSADPKTADTPVVLLTDGAEDPEAVAGLDAGAHDFLPKPLISPLIRRKVEFHLEMGQRRRQLQAQARLLRDQHEALAEGREALRAAIEERTGRSLGVQAAILETVAEMAEGDMPGRARRRDLDVLIRALNEQGLYAEAGQWDKPLVVQSSRLHDVGKLAIERSIIQKPDKLTWQEFEAVKRHTTLGVEMLSKMGDQPHMRDFLAWAKVFAGTHHERWDGSGYPAGLSGQDIPLAGRLMAIADVYEGLTTDRPYKRAVPHEVAVRIIIQGKGVQFDPVLVDVFAQVADEFKPEPGAKKPGNGAGPPSGDPD